MTWRDHLRPWIPPAILAWLRRQAAWGWHGDLPSWAAARHASAGPGYANPDIATQVEQAVREVLAGRAAFERDGIAFAEPEVRWPCLASLLRIHAAYGRLRVLDLGGSLATVWLQHRAWLPSAGLRWCVVEQPGFVAAGRRLFPEHPPEFRDDLLAALADGPWDVVLISNALQYLDEPESVLARIAATGVPHLLLDCLAVTARDRDRITVQRVPEHIYRATYPCRFFAETRIDRLLAAHWREQARWEVDADLPGAEGCRLVGRFLSRLP
jgi:putative methyltransferase (TIGR04325 family)